MSLLVCDHDPGSFDQYIIKKLVQYRTILDMEPSWASNQLQNNYKLNDGIKKLSLESLHNFSSRSDNVILIK
jgi:hypothetical protein